MIYARLSGRLMIYESLPLQTASSMFVRYLTEINEGRKILINPLACAVLQIPVFGALLHHVRDLQFQDHRLTRQNCNYAVAE